MGQRFEYRSHDGQQVEIDWSVSRQGDPPAAIIVKADDSFAAIKDHPSDEVVADAIARALLEHKGSALYLRHFDVPALALPHGQAGRESIDGTMPRPDASGLRISHQMSRLEVDPRKCTEENGLWRHRDGALTDKGGRPVIESERAMKKELDRRELVYDRGAFADNTPNPRLKKRKTKAGAK